MSQNKSSPVSRTTALCYIRQSYTRNPNDMDSPERQEENIRRVCERNGWIPEWYRDTDGHKSGRYETNRPGWLALKARLGDPDVVAVVANDLSRLHRKGWRVGDLVDYVEEHGVNLVLAAPGREVDMSSPAGRMLVQFIAMLDQWYADDIAQRAKDSIAHRKGQGKVIGLTPFGATRDGEGYLIPTVAGAWYLPDGQFAPGSQDTPPDSGALWRSYYDCAFRILSLYAENQHGLDLLAYQLNIEGWPFRDRNGQPRPIERDDIRRVVANWPAYGGLIVNRRSKDRHAYYDDFSVDEIPFKPERAVFPIDLLRKVARVRRERTVRPQNTGEKKKDFPYPLSGITYCAHCEKLAAEHNNPRLRSRLGGTDKYGKRRYRHKEGVKCGCTNRSAPAEAYEADFDRLIRLLTIRPDAVSYMAELSIQSETLAHPQDGDVDPEAEKQAAIALCKRRIDAAIQLFSDGRIDRDEYLRRIEQNEQEIAVWEARTTETERAALELAMCLDTIEKLATMWDMGEAEDKQGMVRMIFSYIVYDLDTRRIMAFKLKPWADRYMVLRAALYEQENGSNTPENRIAPARKGMEQGLPPQGFEPWFWP